MAEQGSGFGKIVLFVVLGVVALIFAGTIIGWLVSALWNILVAVLIIGAIVGVGMLVIAGVRRTLSGGRNRRQLPY